MNDRVTALTPERWQQIEHVLDAVLECAPAAWPALLDEACAGDPDLRREVESLLRHYPEVEGFLQASDGEDATGPMVAAETDVPCLDFEGQRVGSYRIVREIARGGMGRVFLAERADGTFEQQVALKLLRAGLEDRPRRLRFQAEQQILARLNHPNVARLLDGGVTNEDRPYLVMEHVDGVPIDQHCDEHQLSVDERLQLFTTIGGAVQFAHRNLVVHRDLKPANVLVTESGQAKLLDFGIAKLLNPDESGLSDDDSLPITLPQTRTGRRWMTPGYAAPEQIRGEAITTATDVYQLGVVLYELLTGRPPFDHADGNLHEAERIVLERMPEKPSTVVTRPWERQSESLAQDVTPAQVSEARGTEPQQLHSALTGDLDAIVLKALRKEPERRYASVEAFVEDIARHLDGRPVQARRGTLRYRTQKFVRRHQWKVAAAAVFVLLVAGYAMTVTIQHARVQQALATARLEAEKSMQVTDFMMGLFEANEPGRALGDTITARQLLERGAERAGALEDHPAVQAQMLHILGRIHLSLGRYEEAQPLLDHALSLRRSMYGARHEHVAETQNSLGRLLRLQGAYDEAEELHRQALATRRELLGENHPAVSTSLNNLAVVLHVRDDLEAAEPLYREALGMRRRLLGEHEDVAVSLNNLGLLLRDRGESQAAASLLQESLSMRRTLLGEEHPKVAISMGNLALLFRDSGDYDRAESLYRRTLAMWRNLLGGAHPYVATALNDLGITLLDRGKLEEAEPLLREALTLRREVLGKEHVQVTQSLNNLAGLRQAEGDIEAAEALYREALAVRRELLGEDHRLVALNLHHLAALIDEKGDCAAAEPLYRRAIEIRSSKLGRTHWRTAHSKANLGACLAVLGRYEEAEPLLVEGYARLKEQRGSLDNYTQDALDDVVALYRAWGKPDQAMTYEAYRDAGQRSTL